MEIFCKPREHDIAIIIWLWNPKNYKNSSSVFPWGGGGKKKKEKETRNRIVHTFEFENGDGWIFHEVCGKFGREKKCGKFENLGVVLERKQVCVTASDNDFLLAHTRHDTFETRWIMSIIDPRWNERTHTSVMESKYYHMTAAE